MFQRILVAVDGSDHSRRAALTAATGARDLGANLTLLTVYREPPDFEGEPNYSGDLEFDPRRRGRGDSGRTS